LKSKEEETFTTYHEANTEVMLYLVWQTRLIHLPLLLPYLRDPHTHAFGTREKL